MKILILLTLLTTTLIIFKTTNIYLVSSSSMEPTIKKGSVIVNLRTNKVTTKDIVTYKIPQSTNPITHRIIETKIIHSSTFYFTKGDNNKSQDPYPISKQEIIDKMLFSIPYIGYLLENVFSYKFLWLTFYIPIGFFAGKSIKKLFLY